LFVDRAVDEHFDDFAAEGTLNGDRLDAVHWGSGDDGAVSLDRGLIAEHQAAGEIVVLTDVLESLFSRTPAHVEAARPDLCVGTGIIDSDFIRQHCLAGACEPLNEVQLFGVWHAFPIHPEAFIEADRIDDQSVVLPLPDRVPIVAWAEACGVTPSIHVEDPVGVGATDIEDIDAFKVGYLDDLNAIRSNRLARSARRFAAAWGSKGFSRG